MIHTLTAAVAKKAEVRSAARKRVRSHSFPFLFGLVVATFCCGCGYTVGNGFVPNVRTVSVPVFKNETFRRGIEYQLTDAVQKEIQQHSPYRLAKGDNADTRLTGRIVEVRKSALTETGFDDPRELQVSLVVRVTWENLRSGEILARHDVPLSPESIPQAAQAEFAPEVGQSLATGTQDAINQLARRIVNLMEIPW